MDLPIPVTSLGYILVAGFLGALLAKLSKLPIIVGYLFGGVVVGALTTGHLVGNEVLRGLAEFGVAMLMFSVGVEISFGSFKEESGKTIVLAALLQVLLTMSTFTIIAFALGASFPAALFLGAALSLSSTAVVVKILESSGHLGSIVGEISVTWMLIQDLLVVPFFFFLPLLSGYTTSPAPMIVLVLKTSFVLLLVAILGRKIGRFLLATLARTDSTEILLLGLIVWVIVSAAFSVWLGLTPAIGAFLAGVTVGGSDHETFILTITRPIRDLFAAIFFTSLGLFLPPQALVPLLVPTILGVAVVLLVKFIISFGLLLFFGHHSRLAIDVAAPIAGVGEFAFLIMNLGLSLGIIGHNVFSLTISLVLFSIAATPAFIWVVRKIFASAPSLGGSSLIGHLREHLSGHIIICGFGRVGFWVGEALKRQDIPLVVIDYHHHVLQRAKQLDIPFIYGDASIPEVLEAAGIRQAKALVVTTPDVKNQEGILRFTRTVNQSAYIIARAHRQADKKALTALGAQAVIQPEFEASLSILHRILQEIGLSKDVVAQTVRSIRAESRTLAATSLAAT